MLIVADTVDEHMPMMLQQFETTNVISAFRTETDLLDAALSYFPQVVVVLASGVITAEALDSCRHREVYVLVFCTDVPSKAIRDRASIIFSGHQDPTTVDLLKHHALTFFIEDDEDDEDNEDNEQN